MLLKLDHLGPEVIMNPKVKIRAFKPPPGEAYGRIEGPKGELGFYLISDGSGNPYRYRVRPPSFINLTILEDMGAGSGFWITSHRCGNSSRTKTAHSCSNHRPGCASAGIRTLIRLSHLMSPPVKILPRAR